MITVEHLTKCYGDFTAVNDLSFEIGEGHVYGFLGPNGAGKSTTMNIMTGCLSPTEGHVMIDGYDILDDPGKAKKRIGYLPEQPPLYLNETPLEYLRFVGEAKGLRGAELTGQIEEVIGQTKLEEVKHKRIGTLSKGYRQRVGIAQALLGRPGVIILDEPTVGLDPIQIIEIRDLIRELGKTHTVVFSSHILSEVQTICDRILIISRGKLVAFDTPENLEKQLLSANEITLVTDAEEQEVRAILAPLDGISETEIKAEDADEGADGPALVRASVRTDRKDIHSVSGAVFRAFAASGKTLFEMSLKRANLEEVFLELTESAAEEDAAEEKGAAEKKGVPKKKDAAEKKEAAKKKDAAAGAKEKESEADKK